MPIVSFDVAAPPRANSVVQREVHGLGRSILSLLGGFSAMLAIGAVYGWGVIAAHLADYGYTMDDKLVIGTIGALSVYVTPHLGFFYDKFGPRASLMLGMGLVCAGWLFTMWGVSEKHPAILIGLYQSLCGQAVQPVMLAALETPRNFPLPWRGTCTAIVLVGFGMTSLFMAQLVAHLYGKNMVAFMGFMAVSTTLLILFQFLVFASPPPPPTAAVESVSAGTHIRSLLADPLAQPFFYAILAFAMALYCFVINVADMNKVSESPTDVPTLITSFSACNVLSRLVVGFMSDVLPCTRAQLLALGSIVVSLAMLLLGFQSMLAASIVIGIADGFMFAVWVPLTREMHTGPRYGLTFACYLLLFGVGDVLANAILGSTVLPPTHELYIGGARIFDAPLFFSVTAAIGVGTSLMLDQRIKKRASEGL